MSFPQGPGPLDPRQQMYLGSKAGKDLQAAIQWCDRSPQWRSSVIVAAFANFSLGSFRICFSLVE